MKQVLVKGHAGKHLLENSLYVLLGPDRERISICGTTKRQLVRATHHELYLIRTCFINLGIYMLFSFWNLSYF